ncbi:MAG: hypothetical protein ACRC6K_01885 [Fusobacteriaceae bacterium]
MVNRVQALGQFLILKKGKNFDFKQIKMDSFFKGVLFLVGTEYFVVSDKESEILETVFKMSTTRFCDYPAKFAKKYTHMRFVKANQKSSEILNLKGKKYYIVTL